ncbi:hypothetical protein Rcae01_00553 [Novipirellula caenicola]|uniref:Uncharacterized protein n=1 Tax=Novipirellula caenicola TaxID=1536901 RepID=A0ABP9VIU2_9BACT
MLRHKVIPLSFCLAGVLTSFIYAKFVGIVMVNDEMNRLGHASVDWTSPQIAHLNTLHFIHVVLPSLLELACLLGGSAIYFLNSAKNIRWLFVCVLIAAWLCSRWKDLIGNLFMLID